MPGPVRSGAHTTPARENYAPPASRESESPESVHQPPRPGAQSRSLSVPPDARPECSRRTPRSAPARARSPPLPGPPFPSPFSQPHDAVLTQVRIGRFPARAIEIAPPEVRCFPQARPAGRRYSQRYEQGVSARPTGASRKCGKRASGRCPGVAYGQHAKRASHCGHNASKSLDFAFHGRHLWRRRHSWTAARSPRTHVCPNRGRFGLTLSKGQAYLGPLGSPAKASEFTRLHLQHLTSVTDEGLDRPIRSSGNPDPEPLGFSVRRRRDWMSRRNAVQPWAIWSQCSVYQQVPPQRGGKA